MSSKNTNKYKISTLQREVAFHSWQTRYENEKSYGEGDNIKAKELINIGFKEGPIIGMLLHACNRDSLLSADVILDIVLDLYVYPETYLDREIWRNIAEELIKIRYPDKEKEYEFKDKPFAIWGEENIDENALEQMRNAMRLPIVVSGAAMADCHLGYSLPIGGVVATQDTIVPSFVGGDIACRMMMTVLSISPEELPSLEDRFIEAIDKNSRFGPGASFTHSGRKSHPVMDEDWSFAKVVKENKDLAWEQLGTSGSGNHFLDVGEIEFEDDFEIESDAGINKGQKFVAILTHSGSRGTGNRIATYYSKLAQSLHNNLPQKYKQLAWLDMDSEPGQEYWAAMELMGRYASACHHIIHAGMLKSLGIASIFHVENHHNFCFKEKHGGRDLYVHRKGATPAGNGIFGIIPGSMATPTYLVKGKGNKESLCSVSHGAGRAMSRKQTKETNRWSQVHGMLKERGVRLLSAGLDEVPGGYKDICQVMDAQTDLVKVVAKFTPRIVKMAGEGEPPED